MLKAQPPKGHKLTSSDLDHSVSIMRSRVDKLGVASPEIRKQGSNQIVIELAGVHDPAQAAAIIGTTAQLELYDLEVVARAAVDHGERQPAGRVPQPLRPALARRVDGEGRHPDRLLPLQAASRSRRRPAS